MNILVTGANGQLGNEMRIVSSESSDNFIFTDVNQIEGVDTVYLDITDINSVTQFVTKHNINVIVNCAAWTNVDACETDETLALLAEKLNADAPYNLAKTIKEVGGLLIHVSTDYVFGSEPYNTPCNPDQKGTPTGVYGLTKKKGEEYIVNLGCNYVILRTAWLYSEFGKNFCKTMLSLTATKPSIKVVYDQCGTPTYALDLANAIVEVIKNYKSELYTDQRKEKTSNIYSKSGIYHFTNEGVTSWYDFTQMIARIAGNKNCKIEPCYSSEYPSPVKRPSYSVLDKKTFKDTFGMKIPYWIDSLEVCITNIKKNT